MHPIRVAASLAAALPSFAAHAQDAAPSTRDLGEVVVPGGRASALPTQLPATMEGVTREQIERGVNATDSEDALKYLPSLLVRKRYVGDYNHAILSSRASGTGNSARSVVYGDGILLSNFLGNGVGGLSFPPRWGLVTPEEIERVDVLYGPYAAMYPGNSVGAVVEYVTRMPKKFEAHGQVGFSAQPFDLYGTQRTYRTRQASASVGNRNGAWAWWLDASQTDAQGQPLTFATRLVSAGTAGAATPVRGAVLERNSANQPWYLLGTGTEYRTRQDHLKAKATYDVSGTLRASYVFGLWQNDATGQAASYLRDAAGQPVYAGKVDIGGRAYTLAPADFAATRERSTHFMHGASLKSHTGGSWDWEATASLYDYHRDEKRQSFVAGGTGTLADGAGTGWDTLALRGTWRPQGAKGPHVVDFGLQQERYRLHYLTTGDPGGALASNVRGDTQLQSVWAQDAWHFAPRWKSVLGLRGEHWRARNGRTQIATATPALDTAWPARSETHLSPKAAVSWQAKPDLLWRAAIGRAVRMPTVSELYGATSTANAQFINDPSLKPERSWSGEFGAEKDLGAALLRLTAFAERTHDALYAQTTLDPVANRNVTRVQNVGRVDTRGLELALSASDVGARGLDFNGSITYADSRIEDNAGFVATPGDTLGKRQPNIARWRAAAQAIYRVRPDLSASLGVRYSSPQFRTLDNSDVNGFTYMGVSRFLVADLRVRWQVARRTSVALGIDNLNNAKYWNFHPYPQRSFFAELKTDL